MSVSSFLLEEIGQPPTLLNEAREEKREFGLIFDI